MSVEIIDVDDPEIIITGHTFTVPEDDPNIVHLPKSTFRSQQAQTHAGPSSGSPSQVMDHIIEIIAAHDQQTRVMNARKRASGSALPDPPPRKQQRTSSTTSATTSKRRSPANTGTTKPKSNTANQVKRESSVKNSTITTGKRKESEVIDLCSSSEEDVKPKKPKLSAKSHAHPSRAKSVANVVVKVEPSDSESDYDDAHAGLDLRDESNWISLPKHDANDLISSVEVMSLAPSSATLPQTFHGSFDPPRLALDIDPWDGPYFWTSLRKSIHQPPTITRRRYRHSEDVHNPLSSLKMDNLQAEFNTLRLHSTYRKSSGPINRISQHGGIIAIASATSGGNFDDSGEVRNPHNRANSLMICRDDQMRTCRRSGHNSDACDAIEKYYTVNDVKFDPNCSKRMVSSGNDCAVRVWEHVDSYDGFDSYEDTSSEDVPDSLPAAIELVHTLRYSKPPLDIAYQALKYDSTCQAVLAVACGNGNLYIYPADGDLESEVLFSIAPSKTKHSVGAIAWGRDQTSSYIFASSEPSNNGDYSGAHRALDIHEAKVAYNFSARDAGDAMAVDDLGQRLALFTRGRLASNTLRIYDIGRKNGRQPIFSCDLAEFAQEGVDDDDGEVNCAAFSPDGIFLAVARNDNVVHVYDSRNLERGVLYSFQHNYPNREVAGFKGFGIVEAQWVTSFDGRGLGLVSGGNDGCVRLWDVRQAADSPANGRVIAETDFDIAHFSIGDKSKGEAPLVVGDSGGGISIFDRLGNGY